MRSLSSVLVILWLCALFCNVSTFSIRRRSGSDNDLAQAARLIERQRRRINEFDYLARSRLPDSIPPELAQWGQEIQPGEDEEWLDTPYSPYDETSFPEGFGGEFVETSASEKEEPSKEELDDIFAESPTEIEKKSSSKADSGDDVVAEKIEKSEAKEGALDDLTEDEFKALMSAVEKLQKKAMAKKDATDTADVPVAAPEKVSIEELKEVFDDNNDGNADQAANESAETPGELTGDPDKADDGAVEEAESEDPADALSAKDRETLSSIREYWMLGNMLDGSDKRKKRFTKRALKAPTTIPLEETYRREIERLREQIQQMKLITQIEDMENDALTQTLNEATLSQIEGSVSRKEFQSLESAIHLEEALQDLRNGRVNPLIVELLAEDAVGETDKRGEPLWKKKEKRLDESDLEESYPMFEDDKRAMKREKEYPPWDQGNAENSGLETYKRQEYKRTQDAIEQLVSDLQAQLPEDQEEEPEDTDEAVFSPMPSYSLSDKTASYDLDQPSDSGQCPSTSLLTDCRFADVQGLPIDLEARALCNRHEMCYECGATAGVQQGECDNLYRGQAAILCNQDPQCVVEAELFLKELKLKHRFSTFYEPLCYNSCTAEYIGL